MASVLKLRSQDAGKKQAGELVRLKVSQGIDLGCVYSIFVPQVTLGRAETCDVVISDPKASRVHAALVLQAGVWKAVDRGSANGFLWNGDLVKEATLRPGDALGIGDTILEFVPVEAGTKVLTMPPKPMQERLDDQKALKMRRQQLGGNKPDRRRIILIVVVCVLVLLFLLPNGKRPKIPFMKQVLESESKDLERYLPHADANRMAEAIMKDGLREYFAGNFRRAKVQFETVLQISPNHTLASIYLENCDKSIDESVKFFLQVGKKEFDAGKLRSARGQFQSVMRLLYRDQSSPRYLEAKERVDKIMHDLDGGS